MADKRLYLSDRLGLRPAEVAEVLGLSERTIRQILPELPHLRIGSAVVVPVADLKTWLSEQAQAGKNRISAAVDEVMARIESEKAS